MALDTAKRFLQWMTAEGFIGKDITIGVAAYKLDKTWEPKAPSAESFERLLRSFDHTLKGARNIAMVHLMGLCGLRVGELVGLNAEDLELGNGTVKVRAETSKSRRNRTVDLPVRMRDGKEEVRPEMAEALGLWLGLRAENYPELADTDALFVTSQSARTKRGTLPAGRRLVTDAVRAILKRAARRAGLDPREVTPHRLRHHFGVLSAKSGVPMTALSKALGHSTLEMTARYAEMTDREKREAFAKADIARDTRFPGYARSL